MRSVLSHINWQFSASSLLVYMPSNAFLLEHKRVRTKHSWHAIQHSVRRRRFRNTIYSPHDFRTCFSKCCANRSLQTGQQHEPIRQGAADNCHRDAEEYKRMQHKASLKPLTLLTARNHGIRSPETSSFVPLYTASLCKDVVKMEFVVEIFAAFTILFTAESASIGFGIEDPIPISASLTGGRGYASLGGCIAMHVDSVTR